MFVTAPLVKVKGTIGNLQLEREKEGKAGPPAPALPFLSFILILSMQISAAAPFLRSLFCHLTVKSRFWKSSANQGLRFEVRSYVDESVTPPHYLRRSPPTTLYKVSQALKPYHMSRLRRS